VSVAPRSCPGAVQRQCANQAAAPEAIELIGQEEILQPDKHPLLCLQNFPIFCGKLTTVLHSGTQMSDASIDARALTVVNAFIDEWNIESYDFAAVPSYPLLYRPPCL
jgi:hypothetical protein